MKYVVISYRYFVDWGKGIVFIMNQVAWLDTQLVLMAVLIFLRRLMYGSLHNDRPSVIEIEVKFRYEILFVLNVINSFLSFQWHLLQQPFSVTGGCCRRCYLAFCGGEAAKQTTLFWRSCVSMDIPFLFTFQSL